MEELKMRERQRTLRVQAQICKGRGEDKKIDPRELRELGRKLAAIKVSSRDFLLSLVQVHLLVSGAPVHAGWLGKQSCCHPVHAKIAVLQAPQSRLTGRCQRLAKTRCGPPRVRTEDLRLQITPQSIPSPSKQSNELSDYPNSNRNDRAQCLPCGSPRPGQSSNVYMRKVTTNGEAYPSLLPGVRRRVRQPVYSRKFNLRLQ
jgi:hypothetical protein